MGLGVRRLQEAAVTRHGKQSWANCTTVRSASSVGSANSGRQISRSGSHGSRSLNTMGEPSMRLTCRPGGQRDGCGRGGVPLVHAAVVHVDVGVAGDDCHRLRAGRAEAHGVGVERVGDDDGNVRIAVARRDEHRPFERWIDGTAGGGSVQKIRSSAGMLTAPAARWSASHRAMCTAQSGLPSSPNSLVPSSGSTIHTRSASKRRGSSRPSSDSTASSGRAAASSCTM